MLQISMAVVKNCINKYDRDTNQAKCNKQKGSNYNARIAEAQKDLSIREYVEHILEQVVPPEKSFLEKRGRLDSAAIEDLLKTREEIIRAHPGQVFDSAETLHQLREERLKELEQL